MPKSSLTGRSRRYGFDGEAIKVYVDVSSPSACMDLTLKLNAGDVDGYMQLRACGNAHDAVLQTMTAKQIPRFTIHNCGHSDFKWVVKNIDWGATSLKTAIKLALLAQRPHLKRVGSFDIAPRSAATLLEEITTAEPAGTILFDY